MAQRQLDLRPVEDEPLDLQPIETSPAPVSTAPDFDFPTGSPLGPRQETSSRFRENIPQRAPDTRPIWELSLGEAASRFLQGPDRGREVLGTPESEGSMFPKWTSEPETFAGGFAKSLYNDFVVPMGSPSGFLGSATPMKGNFQPRNLDVQSSVPPVAKKPSFTRIGENEKGVVYRNNDTGEEILQPKKPSADPNFNQGQGDPMLAGSTPYPPARDMRFPSTTGELTPEAPVVSRFGETKATPYNPYPDTSRTNQARMIMNAAEKVKKQRGINGDLIVTNPTASFVEEVITNAKNITPKSLPKLPEAPQPYPYVKDLNALAEEGEKRLGGTVPPQQPPSNTIPPLPPEPPVPPGNIPPIENLSEQLENAPLLHKIFGAFKGLRSSSDMGPLFRQGKFYAFRPAWRKAFVDQAVSYFSDAGYQKHLDSISSSPIMQSSGKVPSWADRMGLSITKVNSRLQDAEEGIMGGDLAAELLDKAKVGKVVNPIRASNRAYTAALNRLRVDVSQDVYNQYKKLYEGMVKTAKSESDQKAAELFNPDNPILGKRIAEDINVSTGRGTLKTDPITFRGTKLTSGMNLEKNAVGLNLIGFSPRYFSSQVGTIKRIVSALSPYNYAKIDRIQRMEYLKQLLSFSGLMAVSGLTYSALGARFGTTPSSSDLGKSRFGKNITMDTTGGMGKFATAPSQIAAGGRTSGQTGRFSEFGQFGRGDGLDVVENFLEGMGSPIAGLTMDLLRGKGFTGEELKFGTMNPWENTVTKNLVVPMITQDLYDIVKEDPSYLYLLAPTALGQSIQVYEDPRRPKKPLF